MNESNAHCKFFLGKTLAHQWRWRVVTPTSEWEGTSPDFTQALDAANALLRSIDPQKRALDAAPNQP